MDVEMSPEQSIPIDFKLLSKNAFDGSWEERCECVVEYWVSLPSFPHIQLLSPSIAVEEQLKSFLHPSILVKLLFHVLEMEEMQRLLQEETVCASGVSMEEVHVSHTFIHTDTWDTTHTHTLFLHANSFMIITTRSLESVLMQSLTSYHLLHHIPSLHGLHSITLSLVTSDTVTSQPLPLHTYNSLIIHL